MTTDFDRVAKTNPFTVDSSFSDVIGDDKIRRSLFRVPSDQKDLLFREQTWAHVLAQRPNGLVNVPPHVLEQVKALHIRRKREATEAKAEEPLSDAEDDSDAPGPPRSQLSPSPLGKRNEDQGKSILDRHPSEPTSGISNHNPSPRSQESDDEEPSQRFMTQLSDKSPIEPTFVLSSPEHSKLPEFPSSPTVDDELEVEVPAALAYNPVPINKSALPMLATPPSAQVVPCTFEQSIEGVATTSSAETNPGPNKPKRHIYKPVPELYRGPQRNTSTSHLVSNTDCTKATSTSEKSSKEKGSSAIDTDSSSIVPSTIEHRASERTNSAIIRDVKPAQKLIHTDNANTTSSHIPAALSIDQMASPSIPSPRMVHNPQLPADAAQTTAPAVTGPKTWEAPFVQYTVTYPGYNGTINDFVTACMYIQLQSRKIPTFLYDDFIRAWAEGYLPYVKECDDSRPPRRPLRAIEWYYDIDDDPLFTSRVVTRQNLNPLLNCYPDEVEVARSSLDLSPRQAPRTSAVSYNYTESDIGEGNAISSLPTNLPPLEIQEPEEKSDGTRSSEYGSTPITIQKTRASVTNERSWAQRSLNSPTNHIALHKGPPQSISASALHQKRSSAYEHHPSEAKRISLGFSSSTTSRADRGSGSTSTSFLKRPSDPIPSSSIPESSIPESSRRQSNTRNKENAEEKRRRRLAKHFQRRLAGRESIASSAPLNSPTTSRRR